MNGRNKNPLSLAKGKVFVFLHGHRCLPRGFDNHCHEILARPRVVAGVSKLPIDKHLPGLRIVEA